MVYLLPCLSYLAGSNGVFVRPSDPDAMTNTALEAISSSSGKNVNNAMPHELNERYYGILGLPTKVNHVERSHQIRYNCRQRIYNNKKVLSLWFGTRLSPQWWSGRSTTTARARSTFTNLGLWRKLLGIRLFFASLHIKASRGVLKCTLTYLHFRRSPVV